MITATIDNLKITTEGEKNLLELVRKAGIELPTFCYHSEISVYGACRMCMVEVEGRGIVPACSTAVTDGMVIRTNTKQIRDMRKMIIELMLAAHDQSCTTCPKSNNCKLQSIATQMGITNVRFKSMQRVEPVDDSAESIVRDPSKCILCGDCVRICNEIQSVGALNFAYRGADMHVLTSFNKNMRKVECVNCGQCVRICPVGALLAKRQIDRVWTAIHDKTKTVVAQIAPAVRVALGEYFGKKPGALSGGKIISALRRMGFDKIYDTGFSADLTVMEEGKEFLARKQKGENLPLFTSCCPAWVKFAEQYYPDLLDNLSTCRSPQQMLGSLCKDKLPAEMGIKREDLVVVSIMPCTAKKYEANRAEFKQDGNPDVDAVITTDELALMMKEYGIEFDKLDHDSFDMPFGFSTGGGIIFGASGGVSEAVLRYTAGILDKGKTHSFKQLRGDKGIKLTTVEVGGKSLRLAAVNGLANARILIDKIRAGEEHFDIVEVMACCGGCVNGGGQPVSEDHEVSQKRAGGLYDNDKVLQFSVSNENPCIQKVYDDMDGHKAHELLHTKYENRRRIRTDDFVISEAPGGKKLDLTICFGTSCFNRGSQELYKQILQYLREKNIEDITEIKAKFCGKVCQKGPFVVVNGKTIIGCTFEMAVKEMEEALIKG